MDPAYRALLLDRRLAALISGAHIDGGDPLLTEPDVRPADAAPSRRWLPIFGAVIALTPFLVCISAFRKLFWFGDEWDQLKEFQRLGVWRYVTATFAENFVPLFKAMWLLFLAAGRGSYLVMLAVLWVTHALNVLLLGLVLGRIGVGAAGIAVALVWAGLPASNVETLGWTVQWSAVLALSFFFFAILQFLRFVDTHGHDRTALGLLAVASLASSLSFSRGVLSGFAIAFTCVAPLGLRALCTRERLLAGMAALLPALLVGTIIACSTHGNHERVLQLGVAAKAAQFAAHFFLLNPLQAMWDLEPRDSLLYLLGAIKIAIFGVALLHTRATARWLVWLALVLDATNAILVGIGRFHTGLGAAVGSRYQYVPLFCLATAVAMVVEGILDALRAPRLTRMATVALPILLAWFVASRWPDQMRSWSGWRGTQLRLLLQTSRDATRLPYVAGVSTAEAAALSDTFHLH
jgi:hypothetical protein